MAPSSKKKASSSDRKAATLELAKSGAVKMVDFKFTDVPGTWQHITYPAARLDEDLLVDGVGFDASSIRGFAHINESDMLLMPDIETAIMDPACKVPTLSVVCDVADPISGSPYPRDPRGIAKNAEAYLKTTGIADTAFFGPELEFFIFDSARFDQNQHFGYYHIDSDEGIWNCGKEGCTPNHGHRPKNKEGYFPVPPADSLQDLRSQMVLNLMAAGIETELHHHEVATAGQGEIGMKFQTLTKMADNVMLYKYVLKNTAKEFGKTVTFMPKPLFGDNGTGMHTHQSLFKGGENTFYDKKGYSLLSQTALYYIGGLLAHSPALLGLTNPSTNSYRRLVPGFEAPVNLVYSQRNRSAAVRIPVYSKSPKSKRIEYRPPDSTSNPYLAFSAMLLAGLDGIKKKISPGEAHDMDMFELSKEEISRIKTVPGSLEASLSALEADHDFLLQGGVFSKDFIENWIEYKRTKENDFVRLRPVPAEFFLYYSC
ncbi:type I glutamate--ammonia ligase [Methanomassiliicoccus luminyensis]|uniref:type I glutamate--ammonia ligase n=1 Tax=Methanomassiliicoccus luminyensis TaxID=1080712 RepID=UPI00035CE781|nr:type I glutamate--ammonia ligase [Methanomassiliicoccus luminyensis]